jgi:hypothetical protein
VPDEQPERHEFLSPAWIDAVARIHDEYRGRVPAPSVIVRANVVVTDAPFDQTEIRGSIDTSEGLVIEANELADPDFTATLDYDTAKALFVDQDPQAVMQAFFGGKIRLTGDASKLLAIPMPKPGDSGPDIDLAREVVERIRAVTA